jgi:hypothetical protein
VTPATPDKATIEVLQARLAALETTAASRPLSSVDQLKADIAEAFGLRKDAATAKGEARDVTNATDTLVHELIAKQQLGELSAAATAFRDPAFVATTLQSVPLLESLGLTTEATPLERVTALAKAQPALLKNDTDLDLTSAGKPIVDPGIKSVVAQIVAARQ